MFLLQEELECAILKYISNTIFDAVSLKINPYHIGNGRGGHLGQLIGTTGKNSTEDLLCFHRKSIPILGSGFCVIMKVASSGPHYRKTRHHLLMFKLVFWEVPAANIISLSKFV